MGGNKANQKIRGGEVKKQIKLMDVTLRDGGYRTNFNFPLEFVHFILSKLDNAGIEYIEIGYRNGSIKPIPNIGITGICDDKYISYCRNLIKRAKLTVMLHPKNISPRDILELADNGVDSIRICYNSNTIEPDLEPISIAKKNKLEVCCNITRISQSSCDQMATLVKKIINQGADVIYFADSNGSLNPTSVRDLFLFMKTNFTTKFGFHAHDNIFLAHANAIAAVEQNVQFIDTALLGFGKGAGNVRTEGFAAYLGTLGEKEYKLCELLEAAKHVRDAFCNTYNPLPIKEIIAGSLDLSYDDMLNLGDSDTIAEYYENAKRYTKCKK